MLHRTHLARVLRGRSTDSERLLWSRLRSRQIAGVKFRRQVPIGCYIVDFASFSPRIVVEVDGGQHADTCTQLRNGNTLSQTNAKRSQVIGEETHISPVSVQHAHDLVRDAWLEEQGYIVLRFWNSEVLRNLEGVVSRIYETVTLLCPAR